jgi:hypothetical protein
MCDVPPLAYITMQTLGGRDRELWSNEYLPGIGSAGPYPAVNHVDAFPPTRYASTMRNEDPPHVAIVSVHFFGSSSPFADGGCTEGPWSTST